MKLVLLFILFALAVNAQNNNNTCSYDYDCGNIPYRYCGGGANDCTTTLGGIAVEGDKVYYAQICRTTSILSNITFKSVSVSGSVPRDIATRVQVPAAFNPQNILGVVNGILYYDIVLRQPGRGLRSLNVNTGVESIINPVGIFPQSNFEFDTTSTPKATYFCNYKISSSFSNYTIERHAGIPVSGDFGSDGTVYVMPSSAQCGPLKRFGASDLYFVNYQYIYTEGASAPQVTTSFYHGTTGCVNCALPFPFFTTNEQVVDFVVSSSGIYYATSTGIFKLSLNGSSKTQVFSGAVTGIRIVGSTLYYNAGLSIKSIKTDGSVSTLLNLAPKGTCVCRPVFVGDNCQTCLGQVQWGYNNQPDCVPTDVRGVPATCQQDFQCGNAPYRICAGSCICRPNFTGDKCDICPYTVTWNEYGAPVCAPPS